MYQIPKNNFKQKKQVLQSDTYSMISLIKDFKLAKRYNKITADMNIHSKSTGSIYTIGKH